MLLASNSKMANKNKILKLFVFFHDTRKYKIVTDKYNKKIRLPATEVHSNLIKCQFHDQRMNMSIIGRSTTTKNKKRIETTRKARERGKDPVRHDKETDRYNWKRRMFTIVVKIPIIIPILE